MAVKSTKSFGPQFSRDAPVSLVFLYAFAASTYAEAHSCLLSSFRWQSAILMYVSAALSPASAEEVRGKHISERTGYDCALQEQKRARGCQEREEIRHTGNFSVPHRT